MTSVVLPFVLLSLLTLNQFVLSDSNTITGLKFGYMETFLETNGYVSYLAEDILIPGNILYSEGHTLRTTDGKTVQLIAGSSDGYTEGISTYARFNLLAGFLQTNSTNVLVADFWNHCLRNVNRLTKQTSRFVGSCTNSGLRDGYYADGLFFTPWSVIRDVNYLHIVIVTDVRNKALRSLNLNTGEVITLIRDLPDEPFQVVFNSNKEGMFIIMRKSVGRFNIKTLAFRTITSATNSEGLDGDFSTASFKNALGILSITDELHLVADEGSNKIRIVDMAKRTIASICDGISKSVDGLSSNCSLLNPRSLLLKSETLFLGENQHIRSIKVKIISPCNNISVKLSAGEEVKCIEIIPGHNMCYPPGIHSYKINDRNCSIVISITKELNDTVCPNAINEIADAATLKAKVSLSTGHEITLPVGEYVYNKKLSDNMTCEVTVHVSDPRLKRRLDISADYQLSCPLLHDLNAIILSVAKMRYGQIQLISSGYCNQSADKDVAMECTKNILRVSWPTDCIFQSNSVDEQEKVVAAVKEYLQKNKIPVLELVIPGHIPPIIKPLTTAEKLPAMIVLAPFCSGGLKYLSTTQTCL